MTARHRSPGRTVAAVGHALTTLVRGVPPRGLGSTPLELVFKQHKLELHRVLREEPPRFAMPVLLIPPLGVRTYIYDLLPAHSLLRTLRDAGFDVFVVDFGVPDDGDTLVRLDDYVLELVPACVEQTLRASGADQLALAGYCMGGLFGLIHVGTHADERVRALVTVGSPVNFRKMGLVTAGARLSASVMDRVIDLVGNVPGVLSSTTLKLISAPRLAKSYVDLLFRLDDVEHVRSFRAINYWINDMIPYPQEAFRQLFWDVVRYNKLRKGELRFNDHRCDLGQVRCSLLAFAGANDIVAPPDSIREIVELVGSTDKELCIAPGGHVGVVAGAAAPEQVWRPMVAWLGDRLRPVAG